MADGIGSMKGREPLALLQSAHDVEKAFLSGKRDRGADLESAVRIFLEFLKGFEFFDVTGPCVTVFGSARFTEDHPHYRLARDLVKLVGIAIDDVALLARLDVVRLQVEPQA